MKILIDARMYGLENTGLGRYLISLIRELKTLGKSEQFIVLLRKKYFDNLSFPDNWMKVLTDIPHYSFREQLLLPSVLKKLKPDLVHFPHLNIPYNYKGKYVLTLHDLTMQRQASNASKLPLTLYYLKRIPFLLIARKAVKNSVKILVPSKTTATELANYYNVSIEKIAITYEGYSFKKSSGLILTGELSVLSKYGLVGRKYFFYIGKAYPHKNLKIMVRAVKDLNENKKMDTLFVIAGLQDYFYNQLENYIKDIKARNVVKLIGYVKDEDLPVLYKNSVGFVYPSLSEGFGLQGLEAISMGTTLACSNIPVFKEIYDFHAFYFDPKDVMSVSSTLFSVYNMNAEEKNRYVKSAQKFIEKYSWKKMAEQTLEVYKSV